jgi:glycosyltransferase involved in cell wall biosynthesis
VPTNDLAPGPEHEAIARRAERSGMRRVHVLAFRDRDDPEAGGSELHASQVGAHLVRAGVEVTHHTAAVPGLPSEVLRDGVRVVRRGGRLGVFPRTALDERSGRLGPCDGIVEVFHGVPFFAPVWARRIPQIGVVHHVHLGTWGQLLGQPGATVGELLERHLVPRAYRRRDLVTVAASTRDEIVRAYRVPPEQVRVVPNGLHPRFSPGGTRAPGPLVVAVTRLMPQKGGRDLLATMAAVARGYPATRFAVVGDGPELAMLQQEAVRLGIADAVTFAGRVPDDELVDWYRRAWVVLSTSHREGFGLTLAEAAGCATPTVARRIPGHTDAVLDGRTGILADDVEGMADAVVRLLGDGDLRAALGRAGRDHALALRWEATARGIFDALCDVADRRR